MGGHIFKPLMDTSDIQCGLCSKVLINLAVSYLLLDLENHHRSTCIEPRLEISAWSSMCKIFIDPMLFSVCRVNARPSSRTRSTDC